MLIGVEVKTGSLPTSLDTPERSSALTPTTSLCLMASMSFLCLMLHTYYLGRFFGSDPYRTYIKSKTSLCVDENLSVFSGSNDSHIEHVTDVAISFGFSFANVILLRVVFRRSL